MKTNLWYSFLYSLLICTYCKAQEVSRFVLVDAGTDEDIRVLENGDTLFLSALPTRLNVRADVEGTVGSVRFAYNGDDRFRTENIAPFALHGDQNGKYNDWLPETGQHQLKATPFTKDGAAGEAGVPLDITFVVVAEAEVPLELPENLGTGAVTISGEQEQWHKVSLSFDGPEVGEETEAVNPFLDFRLNVRFSKGDTSYLVPGYFAADGNAAETSASSGNVWRVHFAPDATGEWSYEVSFRFGAGVAVSDDPAAGVAVPPLDAQRGSFVIAPSDKKMPDLRAVGRLQYTGERYLQFAGSGAYFLKGGSDAPENLLAYEDFDNTPNKGNRRKSYTPHADDWQEGNPSWKNDKGTELIGALNYLASKGVNAFSFLTMNIGGDDKNVFPYVSDADFGRFDCSKLDQWEIVFSHAETLGMYLHFKTQETENDQLLDGGRVETYRKLYYRELIARFSHHLALNWNMGEENSQTEMQHKEMAAYFHQHDPYRHHVVIHTFPGQIEKVYRPLLGDQSLYTGLSIQTKWSNVHKETLKWVEASAASGKKWVVANDEQGSANLGVPPDPGYPGYEGSDPDLHDIRKEVLWGNLMAGGAGLEYYFGYKQPESDLSLQDFRSRDQSWTYLNYALEFFRTQPFHTLQPADSLTVNSWCLAKEGEHYIVYLKSGGQDSLLLRDTLTYQLQWFNPRTGEYTGGGQIQGAGMKALPLPPSDENEDWALVVARTSEADKEACGQTETLFSKDFPYQGSGFYLDDFTDMSLLAINPNQRESAEVATAFEGDSCVYTLQFYGIGEEDGQSQFRLFIDDKFLSKIELPLSTLPWEQGADYTFTFEDVLLKKGTEIRVWGQVGTDGQEFSRARWWKIELLPQEPDETIQLRFVVSNGQDPLAGAEVLVGDQSYLTDTAGVVVIPDVPEGLLAYSVSHEGYEEARSEVSVTGDQTLLVELEAIVVSTTKNNKTATELTLSPNPVVELLTVQLSRGINGHLLLYNTFGQLIQQQQINTQKLEIPVKQLLEGMYWLMIKSEKNNISRAFIVRH